MSGRALRIFEGCVALLVLGVVVCFCFQLSLIKDVSIGEVFRGYLPSSALVKSKGYVFPSSLEDQHERLTRIQFIPILRHSRGNRDATQPLPGFWHRASPSERV
jgi:hypothetical protein